MHENDSFNLSEKVSFKWAFGIEKYIFLRTLLKVKISEKAQSVFLVASVTLNSMDYYLVAVQSHKITSNFFTVRDSGYYNKESSNVTLSHDSKFNVMKLSACLNGDK